MGGRVGGRRGRRHDNPGAQEEEGQEDQGGRNREALSVPQRHLQSRICILLRPRVFRSWCTNQHPLQS